jgi:serine O-acetyltransferase
MLKIKADLRANRKDLLTLATIFTYRFGNFVVYQVHIPIVRQILRITARLLNLVFIRIIDGAQIPAQAKIGPGLRLPHGGSGIIIHPQCTIGSNVTIYHQVTIGENEFSDDRLPPTIGNNVFIGAGAKIIGHVSIGDGAKIGSNAVVLRDVPANATAVGIPAKIID